MLELGIVKREWCEPWSTNVVDGAMDAIMKMGRGFTRVKSAMRGDGGTIRHNRRNWTWTIFLRTSWCKGYAWHDLASLILHVVWCKGRIETRVLPRTAGIERFRVPNIGWIQDQHVQYFQNSWNSGIFSPNTRCADPVFHTWNRSMPTVLVTALDKPGGYVFSPLMHWEGQQDLLRLPYLVRWRWPAWRWRWRSE